MPGSGRRRKSRFESAIRADPDLAEVHFNLALTLHKLGDHREAAIHFKKASELAPTNKENRGIPSLSQPSRSVFDSGEASERRIPVLRSRFSRGSHNGVS